MTSSITTSKQEKPQIHSSYPNISNLLFILSLARIIKDTNPNKKVPDSPVGSRRLGSEAGEMGDTLTNTSLPIDLKTGLGDDLYLTRSRQMSRLGEVCCVTPGMELARHSATCFLRVLTAVTNMENTSRSFTHSHTQSVELASFFSPHGCTRIVLLFSSIFRWPLLPTLLIYNSLLPCHHLLLLDCHFVYRYRAHLHTGKCAF